MPRAGLTTRHGAMGRQQEEGRPDRHNAEMEELTKATNEATEVRAAEKAQNEKPIGDMKRGQEATKQ